MNIFIFLSLILGILGAIFLLLAISLFFSEKKKRKLCVKKVLAKIVDVKEVRDTSFDTISPSVSWYPVYEYETEAGVKRVTSDTGFAKKNMIGEELFLYVNPNNLDQFYSSKKSVKVIYMIMGIVGAFFSCLCLILYLLFIQ